MLLRFLVFLGLKDKPKVLQLIDKGLKRSGVKERVRKMAYRAIELIYWDEISHSNGVFKRAPEDELDPEIRLMPITSILDGCVHYGLDDEILNEMKIKIMLFAAKKDTTVKVINDKYPVISKSLDDAATKEESARGFWNS